MSPSYTHAAKSLGLPLLRGQLTKRGKTARTFTKDAYFGGTPTTRCHEIKSRILNDVHPLHLFRIVQDVDKYKDFLPLCSESKVFENTITDEGRSFRAELIVGFGPLGSMFQTRYISQVSVDPHNLRIETRSNGSASAISNTADNDNTTGMFDSLTSCWQLRPVVQYPEKTVGTSVDFKVEMAVSDPVTIAVLNHVLYNVAESQVEAFHKRCQALQPPTSDELEIAERFFKTSGMQR